MTDWISVNDMLPLDKRSQARKRTSINSGRAFTKVMVYHAGGHDIAMYYEDTGFYFTGTLDDSPEADELFEMKRKTITHWMPLPEEPKT